MIGTYEDAEAAKYGFLPLLSNNGSSRFVYYSGDVVYKVEQSWCDGTNEEEWNNYQALVVSEMDERLALPATHCWFVDGEAIIAMELITGQPMNECYCDEFGEDHSAECLPADMREIVKQYIDDTGGMNVIFDGKKYYIIDMGE